MTSTALLRHGLFAGFVLATNTAVAVQPSSPVSIAVKTTKQVLPHSSPAVTDSDAVRQPVISIILDDIGYRLKEGTRAVKLQGKITFAFLPHTPYAKKLALMAHQQGQEIMLHLPMQAESGKKMGPSGLSENMSEQTLKRILHKELNALPYVRGFNNHMGSYLTSVSSRMRWLMEAAMFHNNLYFVDSKTTASSVAAEEAGRLGIDHTSRDIFLDYEQNARIVEKQLAALLARAKKKGTALAIGHPYPETMSVLEAWLPKLQAHNIKLVHVSELIKYKNRRNLTSWQMSSSPSHRAVKNSKL